MGIASNAGLMVGYQWARSVTTGADTVLKSADYTSLSLPQLGSALAKTALGTEGLLGPAGSGASIAATAARSDGGAITIPNVAATVNVSVDGTPLRVIAQDVVNVTIDNLASSVGTQRG
jgi:hypothetical protein